MRVSIYIKHLDMENNGNNIKIGIIDSNFSYNCVNFYGSSYIHTDVPQGTDVTLVTSGGTFGTSSHCATSTNSHGDQVAAVAAGTYDGGNNLMGVAPLADIVAANYNHSGNYTYDSGWFADIYDNLRTAGAVVANNSWGYVTHDADDIQNYMTTNSVNAANSICRLI